MMYAVQVAANETINNASASVTGGFANSMDLMGPMAIILWTAIVLGMVSAARSNEYFHRLIDALGAVAVSFMYFLHGIAALAVLGVLAAPAYLVATADPSTRSMVVEYAGMAVGGYVVVTVLGYAAKHHVFDPIRSNLNEYVDDADVESGVDAD